MKPTCHLPFDTPGLLTREIVEHTENGFIIRETWDVTVKGCPIVVVPRSDVAPMEYYRPSTLAIDSQWTPEELAEFNRPNSPPIFTVRDVRASAAATFKRGE